MSSSTHRVPRRSTVGRGDRALRLMAVIATLLAILAPALAVAPQPAAAQGPVLGQNVACGRVMQSPFDIIPIVRCDKSALFPNWMTQNASWLGQRPLYQVVLPGAHDALTGHYDKNVDGLQWAVQTQDLNVYGLLFYGVRAFDVRFCTPDTTTQVYYACHGGFYDEKVTPASVISDIRAFTALFPKEILFIKFDWTERSGNQALQDSLCSSFFDAFRDIIIPPQFGPQNSSTAGSTLNEIWSLPNQPRIILRSDGTCGHYFNTDPEGETDRGLNWTNYNGGIWANSANGFLSGPDECANNFNTEYICTDVAYVNTEDLTDGSIHNCRRDLVGSFCTDDPVGYDPSGINSVQAVVTDIARGVFTATNDEWPEIRDNLNSLWNNNTEGARRRFNLIWGDFVEHHDLVELAIELNEGPVVIPRLTRTDDGTPYVPGPENWTSSVTITVDCTTPQTTRPDFPADRVAATGPDIQILPNPSAPGSTSTVSAPMRNGIWTAFCWDTSGKTARMNISGINIDPTPPVITRTVTEGFLPYVAGTWANRDVTVTDTCVDQGVVQSGIATDPISGSVTRTDETSETFMKVPLDCVDAAGNVATPLGFFGPIRIDKTRPLVTTAATTADGQPYSAGAWTNQDVTVAFACTDQGSVQSGVAAVTFRRTTTLREGDAQFVMGNGLCFDRADNVDGPDTFGPVRIDKTAPLVTYTGNQEAYAILDTVAIDCAASDALSGVASNTCQNISGPAYAFGPGSHTFSASATDIAGNAGSGSTSFIVDAGTGTSYDDLCTLTRQFVDEPGNGHANSMCVHLRNAERAAERGKLKQWENSIAAYLHGVDVAEHGGHLSAEEADILRTFAGALAF